MQSAPEASSLGDTEFLLQLTSTMLSAPLSVRERARVLIDQLVPRIGCHASVESPEREAARPLATSVPCAEVSSVSALAARGVFGHNGVIILQAADVRPPAQLPEAVASIALATLGGRLGEIGTLVIGFERSDAAAARAPLIGRIARLAGFALEKASLYDEADRATRAREEILALVAHDLRNPLTAARLAISRVENATDPSRDQAVGVVKRSLERALLLVNDLLDVNAVEDGRLAVTLGPHSLSPLFDEVRTLFEPIVERAGLDLHVSDAFEIGLISCDPRRLVQVLSNLIGNAVKFTPRGGAITVSVTPIARFARFAVSDTGRGIPAEALPRLFERFFQVRRGEQGGAGLGLPIVKGIVEQHGGDITVESTVGAGTTFTFTIPLAVR